MAKLIALYKHPVDKVAFDEHYEKFIHRLLRKYQVYVK